VKFACIRAEKASFPVKLMCRCLAVSRSGFYAWLGRPESQRLKQERGLVAAIHAAHERSRAIYGSPRVHAELRATGHHVSRKRVARLMRQEGLRARRRRKFLSTTDSRHHHPAAPNLLDRQFNPPRPNTAWASDATFIPTREGWLLLAVIIDLFSRRIVGWAMGAVLDKKLILAALEMAIRQRRPGPGLIHHSDRGRQYASAEYRQALADNGITASMSRLANCWDNAVVESFFGTLKSELVNHTSYATRSDAKSAVFEYIEVFYNRQRRHSALRYRSPAEYEMKRSAT